MKIKFDRVALLLTFSILLSMFSGCTTTEISENTEAEILSEIIAETYLNTEPSSENVEDSEITTILEETFTEIEASSAEIQVESTTESEEQITTEIEFTTESELVIETEPIETEFVRDVISFVDYTKSSRGLYDLKSGDIAMSFTVPYGYLKTLYVNITDKNSYTDVSVTVNLYEFDGNYNTSVKAEPIYSEYITRTLRTYAIEFDEYQIGEGRYLMVVSYVEPVIEIFEDINDETTVDTNDETQGEDTTETETAPYSSVVRDNCWTPKTFPDDYDIYKLVSYVKGKKNNSSAICGGLVIVHGEAVEDIAPGDTEATETEESQETDSEEGTEEEKKKVKVILLAGQSNATGSSSNNLLKNHVSSEDYAKYTEGFSNVKSLYTSGTISGGLKYPNVCDEFVDTKLGQGYTKSNFGPELGLAAYLAEEYPDETFYIIKYAIGGTSLYSFWNPTDDSRNQGLVEFKETIDEGLFTLEFEDLSPEIVAFLWMQGESDASTFYRAYEYYDLQKSLVENIREEYAEYAPDGGIAFVDAAISNSGFWASWFLLNERKLAYSEESDINYYIDTNSYGLTTLYENNDLAHYDSDLMLLLGKLFGECVAEHINKIYSN